MGICICYFRQYMYIIVGHEFVGTVYQLQVFICLPTLTKTPC